MIDGSSGEQPENSHNSHNSSESPTDKLRTNLKAKIRAVNVNKDLTNKPKADLMEMFIKLLSSDQGSRSRHDSITMKSLISQLGWNEIDNWSPQSADMFFKLARHSKLEIDQSINVSNGEKDFWMLVLRGSITIYHDNKQTTLTSCQALNCLKDISLGQYFENFEWIMASSTEDTDLLILDKESLHSIMLLRDSPIKPRISHRMSSQFHMQNQDSMTKVMRLDSATSISNILYTPLKKFNFYLEFVLTLRYIFTKPESIFDSFWSWIEENRKGSLVSIYDHFIFLLFGWFNLSPADFRRFDGKLEDFTKKLCQKLFELPNDIEQTMFKVNPAAIGTLLSSYMSQSINPDEIIEKKFKISNFKQTNSFSWEYFALPSNSDPNHSTLIGIFITWIKPDSILWNQGLRVGHELIAFDFLRPKWCIKSKDHFKNFVSENSNRNHRMYFSMNLNRFFQVLSLINTFETADLKDIFEVNSYLRENMLKNSYVRQTIEANHMNKINSPAALSLANIENSKHCFPLQSIQINVLNVNYDLLITPDLTFSEASESIKTHVKDVIPDSSLKVLIREDSKSKQLILKDLDVDDSHHVLSIYKNDLNLINQFANPLIFTKETIVSSKLRSHFNSNLQLMQDQKIFDGESKTFDVKLLDMRHFAIRIALTHFDLFRKISIYDMVIDAKNAENYTVDETYTKYLEAQDLLSNWTRAILLKHRESQKLCNKNLKQIIKLLKFLYNLSALNPFYIILLVVIELERENNMIKGLIKANYRKILETWKDRINPKNNYIEYQNFISLRKLNQPFIPFHLCHINDIRRYFDSFKLNQSEDGELMAPVVENLSEAMGQLALYQKIGYNYDDCLERVSSDKNIFKEVFMVNEKSNESNSYEMWKAQVYMDHQMKYDIRDKVEDDTSEIFSQNTGNSTITSSFSQLDAMTEATMNRNFLDQNNISLADPNVPLKPNSGGDDSGVGSKRIRNNSSKIFMTDDMK